MRSSTSLLVVLLNGAAILAAFQPPSPERPRADDVIEGVIGASHVGPPEATADILLSIVEEGRVPDAKRRLEVLEDLWALAHSMKEQSPTTGYSPSSNDGPGTSRVEMLQTLRLDKLSVQIRVIEQMLKVKPALARDRFAEIRFVPEPQTDCLPMRVPSRAEYFMLAKSIFESAFTPEERREGRHLAMMSEVLANVSSPVDLPGAARLLVSLRSSREEYNLLLERLVEQIPAVRGGTRPFFVAVRRMRLLESLSALLSHASTDRATALRLAIAVRESVRRHLEGAQCADIERMERGFEAFRKDTKRVEELRKNPDLQVNVRPDIVDDFNARFAGKLGEMGQMIDPLVVERKFRRDVSEESAAAEESQLKPVRDRIITLLTTESQLRESGKSPLPPELNQELIDVLEDLGRRSPASDAQRLPFYLEKCGYFMNLLDLAFDKESAEAAAKAYISFLSEAGFKQEYSQYWVRMVTGLRSHALEFNGEAQRAVDGVLSRRGKWAGYNPHVRSVVAQLMLDSGDPMIALYGRLNEVVPRKRGLN